MKIVGSIVNFSSPIKPKPFNISNYRVNIFLVFFLRICIIKSKIALPFKFLSYSKIKAY
ncbi:hypothetical protein MCHI_000576 [Candidatus Magnetoovum chiemensis]|nr:hypothetical protein MCHI_000576 [Candidatus Magnetoovum chiemensis]